MASRRKLYNTKQSITRAQRWWNTSCAPSCAPSCATSLLVKFYDFNKSPSYHYPTVSTYNISKPIQSYKKINKNHILHNSDTSIGT